jgi:hypothetical protein
MRLFRKRRPARRRPSQQRPVRSSEGHPGAAEDRPRPAERPLGRALRSSGAAASRGVEATAQRARGARPALRRPFGAVLGRIRGGAARLFGLAAAVERGFAAGFGLLAAIAGSLTDRLARVITPERGVVLVTVVAAGCLVASQFSDYRGVEVGQPAYAEVSSIAPAPMVDVKQAGEAHAYLLIPVAAVAAMLALLALATKRWQLGRLVALAGLVGVGVALLVDLPKGLDEGSAGIGYAGAHAALREGFYAELAASAVLVVCGVLLAINLRRARGPARRRMRAGQPAQPPEARLARSGP